MKTNHPGDFKTCQCNTKSLYKIASTIHKKMRKERKKLLEKRKKLSIFICRKAFRKYKTWEKANDIHNNLHSLLNANKGIFFTTFPKHETKMLHRISDDKERSKRYVFSFLRRLCKYNQNYLIQKRKTIFENGKIKSCYYYAIVKI